MALREELKAQGGFLFKYRGYLPVLFLVAGLIMIGYEAAYFKEHSSSTISEILKSSCVFVGFLGLLIRCFTVGYTPVNTSGRKDKLVADTLNTTGLYSIIRNPLYVGNYLMWLAVCMLTGNLWFVVLFTFVFWMYYERIIYAEEEFLRDKFKSVYLDWTEKTPIFVPKHLNYKKPNIPFNWRRVLEKERNGLFLLCLLFYLFAFVENYVKTGTVLLTDSWEFNATIVTGVIFIILKFLEKKTTVLEKLEK